MPGRDGEAAGGECGYGAEGYTLWRGQSGKWRHREVHQRTGRHRDIPARRLCRGSIYIFCSTEQVSELRSLMVNARLTTRLGIWEKSNPSPVNGRHLWLSSVECCVFGRRSGAVFNEHCKASVWRFPCGRSKQHPTEKPLTLFKYLVSVSSNAGQIVFYPCCGSGTTGVACVRSGRRSIQIEMDEGYTSVARAASGRSRRSPQRI